MSKRTKAATAQGWHRLPSDVKRWCEKIDAKDGRCHRLARWGRFFSYRTSYRCTTHLPAVNP